MSRFTPPPFRQPMGYESAVSPAYNTAVATFFNAVYGWMAAGLGMTAVIAWWASTRPDVMQHVFRGPALIILLIAELGLVFTISAAVNKIGSGAATALFLLYAAINGLTLSAIFIIYTTSSIAGAFIASAAMFGAMSVYGYVTHRDLSGLGSFLFMALIGLIVASVVNVFLASSALSWLLSYAGVAIFVGLTAWDTQKLKYIAQQTAGDPAMAARLSVNGALMLYLDFLNIFLFLLQIMGDRRRD